MKNPARFSTILLVALLSAIPIFAQTISVPDNFARLVAQEDTDGDKKITIHDHVTPFEIHGTNGAAIENISDVYQLSVLLQELKRAEDDGHFQIPLGQLNLNESALDRTHRLIKNFYWDALTRRIDAAHMDEVVHDTKVQSKFDYLYVPATDTNAVHYFQSVEKSESAKNRSPTLKIVL